MELIRTHTELNCIQCIPLQPVVHIDEYPLLLSLHPLDQVRRRLPRLRVNFFCLLVGAVRL